MLLIALLVIIQILVQQPLASYGQQSNWKARQVRNVYSYLSTPKTREHINNNNNNNINNIYDTWMLKFQKNYVKLGGLAQTLETRMVQNADALIKYYAVDMEDMSNFNFHLNKILIPRVPGTKGSQLVREVGTHSNIGINKSIGIISYSLYSTINGI